MSKIVMYSGSTTGTTTTGDQYAFFINENGIPAVKKGSQVITFGTSGYALQGSSGSSGANGSSGLTGTSGLSGTSGQDGAPGSQGVAGTAGSSGESGSSGINGIDGINGTSGSNGASGTSGISYGSSGTSGADGVAGSTGASGTSGSSGADGLGAKSKAGSVPLTGFTGASLIYDVVFASNFANTNYSVTMAYNDVEGANAGGFDPWATNKTVSGFTINTGFSAPIDPSLDGIIVDWMAISQGETGVAVAGTSGTSGTSPAGGGGGDTLYTQQVSVATSQPAITYSGVQWRAIYGDGNQLDQGSGGQYDTLEFGFLQPFFLAPGESIEKVGFYFMDYTNTGTASFKVIICDKHPHAYLPWNLLHSETLTFAHDDVDNKFISWDYDFTNTGSTVNTYFAYILFEAEATRTFEICRTVQYPQHLTYDYRFVTSDNRYNANSHWLTAYHSIYNSLPATMSGVLQNYFFYNNQRGGHMYYQTSRP